MSPSLSDIVAISSLPSIWAQYDVDQIAESLVETLGSSLSLDFAYVCFTGARKKTHSTYSHSSRRLSADDMGDFLEPWLKHENLEAGPRTIQNPLGGGAIEAFFAPIGYNFKNGVLVTGASHAQFPSELDRLIVNIASNQTNVVVEYKWTQVEAQRLLKVAEEATAQAEIAKAEAINATELKSSFLANMSHEIRTPLSAILGFADILKSPTLSLSERNEYLEVIARSGHSLSKIIDDILDLSKIEAGRLEIDALPMSLTELCKEVLAMFSDRAGGKSLQLSFDGSGLPDFNINSDQVRIRQVLVNLIGNAVKFTAHGSIEVSGDYVDLPDNSVRVSIAVKDTGIGMSTSASRGLFKPFIQGDNTTTRKFGGTGLGLALSRKLGKALGGDVTLVECKENKGCTFAFEFVAKKSADEPHDAIEAKSDKTEETHPLKGYKVLVADDSSDNRLLMNLILTKNGAKVEFANDGEEAFQKSMSGKFDAVLMDIQMPVLDGYGALAKLRKQNFRKPIFALTAHAMKEEQKRAIGAGFVAHIPKPINSKELIESILLHAQPALSHDYCPAV